MRLSARLISHAQTKNGTARPSENIARSMAPCTAVSEVEATYNIVPSIGPIQGLQPRANKAPIKNELCGWPKLSQRGRRICRSPERNGMLNTPSIVSPKRIIRAPAARPSVSRHGPKSPPKLAAKSPSNINTTENPITNAMAFINIRLLLFPIDPWGTPAINAKYPGTMGRVHGAKNIKTPATNAPTNSGRSIGLLYRGFYNWAHGG